MTELWDYGFSRLRSGKRFTKLWPICRGMLLVTRCALKSAYDPLPPLVDVRWSLGKL
jgi:hypothetical protein